MSEPAKPKHSKKPCPVCGRERFVEDPDQFCVTCTNLRLMLVPVGAWVADALCAQTDPEAFFPTHRGGTIKTANRAKAVCAQCPVQRECLEYSLEARERHGVWGGLSEPERRKVLPPEEVA